MSRQSELARQLLMSAVYDTQGPVQQAWGGKASLVPTNLLSQMAMDPKLLSLGKVEQIADSILNKGITEPAQVTLGRAPGNPGRLLGLLSDSHHRVSAARTLGLPFFPAVGFETSNMRDFLDGQAAPAVLKGTGRLPLPHLGPEMNRKRYMLEQSVPAIKRLAEAQRRGLPEQLLTLDDITELGVIPPGREYGFYGNLGPEELIDWSKGGGPNQRMAAIPNLNRVIQPESTSIARRSARFPSFIESAAQKVAKGHSRLPENVPSAVRELSLFKQAARPVPKIKGFPGTKGMWGILGAVAAPFIGQKIFGKDDDSFNARTARAVGLA